MKTFAATHNVRRAAPLHSRSPCVPLSARHVTVKKHTGFRQQQYRPDWQLYAASPNDDRKSADRAPPEPEEVVDTVQYAFEAAGDAAQDAFATSQTAAQDALRTSQAAFEEAAADTQDAAQSAIDVAQ